MMKKSWNRGWALLLTFVLFLSIFTFIPQDRAEAASRKSFVIVLDPGHDTLHARGKNKMSGITEQTSNLAIAKALKKDLEKEGFTVYITRDVNCPTGKGSSVQDCLNYRINFAKSKGCDLYVSLHLNAAGTNDGVWRSGHGCTVYISGHSSLKKSMSNLAGKISDQLHSRCGISRRNPNGSIKETRKDGVYKDGTPKDFYMVTRECTENGFASVLIEHLFMDNKGDAKIMKKYGEAGLAKADCAGIVAWYKETGGKTMEKAIKASKEKTTASTAQEQGYVDNEYLNLRKSATTNSKVQVKLDRNDILTILSRKNGWYQVKVKHGGKKYEGYVAARYVTLGTPPKGSDKKDSDEKDKESKDNKHDKTQGALVKDDVNLREGPATSTRSLIMLSSNDILKIGEKEGKWYPVTAIHKGKTYTGYVHGYYVKAQGEGSAIGYVKNDYLNVRAGEGTSTKKIGELDDHQYVVIHSEHDGWYKISYISGSKVKTGYVKASLIRKI